MFTFLGYCSFEDIIFLLLLHATLPIVAASKMFTFQIIQYAFVARGSETVIIMRPEAVEHENSKSFIFPCFFLHGYFRS